VGAVIEALSCLGVPTAMIQGKELPREQASTLFWFCAAFGGASAGLLALLSPYIAGAYGHPELTLLVAVFGLKLIPLCAGQVPQQIMLRALHFHRTSLTQVLPVLLEAVVKIAFVLAGFGAWALVLAHVMRGVSFFAIAFVMAGFRPRFHFRLSELRPFLRFGLWASLANVATEAYKNLDYLLIGRFFGMEVLGSYRIAFDLAMTPAESVAQPIYRVTYPLMVRLGQERDRLRTLFYEASADMVNLVLPVTLIVLFCADDLLHAVSSGQWERALPAIPWLCAAAVMRTVTRLFNNLFFAANMPRLGAGDAIGTLTVLLLLMPTLIFFTGDELAEISVCLAWVVAYPVVFVVLFLLARAKVEIRFVDYLRHVLPGLKAGAVLAPVLMVGTYFTDRAQLAPWLRVLAVAVPAGLLCAWLIRRFRRDLRAQAAV
jgi:O-antigen/teichoic acid export membrane protein